jgi:predicted dehydrogenase
LPEILGFEQAQVIAVCDVDKRRAYNAKRRVEQRYAQGAAAGQYSGCESYGDFRELLARDDIDAVLICTPDHWHVIPAIAAARAGKDIFLQKPLTYTIEEGRILSDTVRECGTILQVGSQQRSDKLFRFACALVRNGRIGKVHTVKVGLPSDPSTGPRPTMPVPAQLDYDFWLGPAPHAEYTEDRVHPVDSYERPGWLRISTYCLGMITGWGVHHNDIAQWGIGAEYTGPVAIEAKAQFPRDGIWDVHGMFSIDYTYADGTKVICADNRINPQGVSFEGSEGWVYIRRGFIDAVPKSLLNERIGPNEIQLYESNDHKANLLECIRSRRQPVAPVEIGHRSCTMCVLGYIAMKLGRKLHWDPDKEQFLNDDEANRMTARTMRSPWEL